MAGNPILVLDTTYILPLFGIKPQISPSFLGEVKDLWSSGLPGFNIYTPSVCLIEVAYKLNQEYRSSKKHEVLERYPLILPTVSTSTHVTLFHPQTDQNASHLAMKIRDAGHSDLMDCWIAGTASSLKGILITEDVALQKLLSTIPELSGIPCWNWKKLQENLKISRL